MQSLHPDTLQILNFATTSSYLLPPNQPEIPLFASDVFFSTVLSNSLMFLFVSLRSSSNLEPASAFRSSNLPAALFHSLPILASASLPLAFASATCGEKNISLQTLHLKDWICFVSKRDREIWCAIEINCNGLLTASSSCLPARADHSSPCFLASLPEPGSSPLTLLDAAEASSRKSVSPKLYRVSKVQLVRSAIFPATFGSPPAEYM